MNSDQANELNQTAYRQLKPIIDKTYPPGRFVAIHEGKVVADAATFAEIDSLLNHLGIPGPHGLVTQAGIEYPDNGFIFPLNG